MNACPACGQISSFPENNFGVHCEGLPCENCGSNARNRYLYHCVYSWLSGQPDERIKKGLELSSYGFATQGQGHIDRFAQANLDLMCGDFYMNNFESPLHVDLTQLQFADDEFDIIFCSHVLEHIENEAAAFSEAYRCIRPGGAFMFGVPIQTDFTFPVSGEFHGDNAEVFRRNGWDILDRMKTAGFRVEVLATPGHAAFRRADDWSRDAFAIDDVRAGQKFGVQFQRFKELFYPFPDEATASAHRYSEIWGSLETFVGYKPVIT